MNEIGFTKLDLKMREQQKLDSYATFYKLWFDTLCSSFETFDSNHKSKNITLSCAPFF